MIGVWCNGNTADSGPAFSGSSPDTPTQKECNEQYAWLCSFFCVLFLQIILKGLSRFLVGIAI